VSQAITRRRFVGLAAGSGVTVVGAACSAPGSGPAAPDKSTVAGPVLFWPSTINDITMPFWAAIKTGFTAAWPKADLQLDDSVAGANQSRDDKLLAGLAAGTAWDVWQRDIPPSYQQVLVDRAFVMAMDDAFATMPNLKRIFPWARERGRLGGKLWGVPYGVEFGPVWVNKGVFNKVGIKTMPKTWDEFLDINRTIKSAGIQPMNISSSRSNPGHYFSMFFMGLIGKDGFEDLLWRDKKWEGHPGVIQAAQDLVDFVKQGWIPQDVRTATYDVNSDFINGKQAMYASVGGGGSSYEAAKKTNSVFDYDFFICPSQDPKIKLTPAGGLGNGFSVWSQTKNAQGSVAFIDYLMSPDAQKLWIETQFSVAPVPFKPEDYKVNDVFARWLGVVAAGSAMGYNISVVVPAGFVDAYWDGLADILTQKLTPVQWTTNLQQQWDVAKREGRVPKP
jgi:ABC-type glycerol-3-phosphate transport system substrate-binding protein